MTIARPLASAKKLSAFSFQPLAFICFIALGFLAANCHAQDVKERNNSFKIKRYHVKADKNFWDAKTGILKAQGNVKISLSLVNGTTAYIYSDHATEERVEERGKAWGNARLKWQDLNIQCDEIMFNANTQDVQFKKNGSLSKGDFAKGVLDFKFSNLVDKIDAKGLSYANAQDVQGLWQPK